MLSKTILATALLGVASAHQNFHQFWVNDETPGYQVGVRMPPSNSPVTDVTSDDMACNVGGSKVPSGVETVAAAEGDTIKVQWDNTGHPGPITHFLYGPVDDASKADGIGAGWPKARPGSPTARAGPAAALAGCRPRSKSGSNDCAATATWARTGSPTSCAARASRSRRPGCIESWSGSGSTGCGTWTRPPANNSANHSANHSIQHGALLIRPPARPAQTGGDATNASGPAS